MSIIVSEDGNNAHKIEESHFGLEDKLQEYVKNNPDIVPIYDIQEGAKLLVVAREFSTNSGPIDALGLDQDGNIYVIETKLYRNPDKRTVLAQALDYGASLWRHSGDTTEFLHDISRKSAQQFGVSFEEKLADFFEVEDVVYMIESISKNLKNGNIKFVILMDQVSDRLKDLVTYVNQNSRFDIYAVDLQYYKHEQFEIVIPKLHGAEVKKTVTSNTGDTLRFDNQKILGWIEELSLDWLNVDESKTNTTYIRLTTKYLNELIPQSDDVSGGWRNGYRYYYEIKARGDGSIGFVLAFNNNNNSPEQISGQQHVINFLGIKPKKPDWQWWYVKRFKLESRGGEELLRNEIRRIITTEIPVFERQLREFNG